MSGSGRLKCAKCLTLLFDNEYVQFYEALGQQGQETGGNVGTAGFEHKGRQVP